MESKEEGFTFVGGGSVVVSISVCPQWAVNLSMGRPSDCTSGYSVMALNRTVCTLSDIMQLIYRERTRESTPMSHSIQLPNNQVNFQTIRSLPNNCPSHFSPAETPSRKLPSSVSDNVF